MSLTRKYIVAATFFCTGLALAINPVWLLEEVTTTLEMGEGDPIEVSRTEHHLSSAWVGSELPDLREVDGKVMKVNDAPQVQTGILFVIVSFGVLGALFAPQIRETNFSALLDAVAVEEEDQDW